jgi:hypothetical protein
MIKRLGLVVLLLAFFMCLNTIQAQDVASDLLGRINNLRSSLGLSPYTLNASLTAAANAQALWMAETGEVTHTQYDGSRPVDRARANGYSSAWVAENIYMGPIAGVDDAWTFWINSSIHYAGLTSTNFQDVGIGTAAGTFGQSFVLVFGNPGGGGNTVMSTGGGGNSGGGAQAEVPQYAILGYDAVGNVRYQLQDGETLGDVLLIFGYTWDDLPAIMSLNNFTDADVRNLDVGQEILVPPHTGTWTPSAPAEASAEVTEPASTAQISVPNSEGTVAPSPTFDVRDLTPYAFASETAINLRGILPTPSGSDSFILPSPTVPVEQIAPPEVFVLASPSPIPSATDANQIAVVPTLAPTSTPLPESPTMPPSENSIPPWLIGAIALQIGVLGYAGFEFLRRWRKS